MAKQGAVPDPRGRKKTPRAPLGSVDGGVRGGPMKLNRVIHERVRLGIVSALAVNESLTFNELKDLLKITDGNLSAHARRLEEAGYVECRKSFAGRVPRTEYVLTGTGRSELGRYLDHMEALVSAVRDA